MEKAAGGGVPRRIDHLGRIVVPVELRRQLGVRAGDELEIGVQDEAIVLRPTRRACVFCGSEEELRAFRSRMVCWPCAGEVGRAPT